MRHFMFLLFLCLYVQESNAGKMMAVDDTEESSSASTRAPKPSLKLLPLEDFSQKVKEFTQKQDAHAFPELLEEFKKLEGEEATWESVAHKQGVERWLFQSWKGAVGAQLFLDAAINLPHQHLLRNGLKPLLSCSSIEEGYAEATAAIHEIIQNHPYIRRRTALYALTAASHLQHPLARLFLTEALRCYDGKPSRFFKSNHFLVKVSLSSQDGKEALRHFIDVSGIDVFVDLTDERDLKNPKKLKEKTQLGLLHYNVLLGDLLYDNAQDYSPYSPEIIDPVVQQYRIAADKGDFDAGFKTYELMSSISFLKIKSKQPFKLKNRYALYAAWHGNEKAYRYAHIMKVLDKKGIPGRNGDIFKAIRKFLVLKHRL